MMNRPAPNVNKNGIDIRTQNIALPMRFVALLLILSLLAPMTVMGRSIEPPSPFKTTLKTGPLTIGLNLLASWWNYATGDGTAAKEKPTAPAGRAATTAVVPTIAERLARMVKIETNAQKLSIAPGQEMALAAIPTDAQGNPLGGLKTEWLSNDPKIATVTDAGRVTGKAAGQTTIIASIGEKRISIPVVVGELPADRSAKTIAGSTRLAAKPAAPPRPFDFGGTELPSGEQDSIFLPGNQVGSPPGTTTPGAATPPAAITGTEMPGSSNFSFSVPVFGIPGRGIDAVLSLVHNSRMWNNSRYGSQTRLSYDVDGGWPAPGFNLGFGRIEYMNGYQIIDPNGTRHRMQIGTGGLVTTDGSFISANSLGTSVTTYAIYPNGTKVEFGATSGSFPRFKKYPVKITDSNGNYIEITYKDGVGPRIYSIKDTLEHIVLFKYDSNNDLVTVAVPAYNGGSTPLQTIRFYYDDLSINPTGSFSSGTLVSAPSTAHVLKYVYFPGTQAGYKYEYSVPYGTIYKITQRRGMTVSTTSDSTTGSVTSDGQEAARS